MCNKFGKAGTAFSVGLQLFWLSSEHAQIVSAIFAVGYVYTHFHPLLLFFFKECSWELVVNIENVKDV